MQLVHVACGCKHSLKYFLCTLIVSSCITADKIESLGKIIGSVRGKYSERYCKQAAPNVSLNLKDGSLVEQQRKHQL